MEVSKRTSLKTLVLILTSVVVTALVHCSERQLQGGAAAAGGIAAAVSDDDGGIASPADKGAVKRLYRLERPFG